MLWSFVYDTDWMKKSITTPKFCVPIKGVLASYLRVKGLSQADFLAPYLFVLAMELSMELSTCLLKKRVLGFKTF